MQLYTDPMNTPIDDVTTEWNSPAVTVATISYDRISIMTKQC